MLHAKPVFILDHQSPWLSLLEGDPLLNCTLYRSIVGGLQYVTMTHSNILFAMNLACKFMHSSTTLHLVVV